MNVHIGVIFSVLCFTSCLVNSFPYKRSYGLADYHNFDPYLLQDLLDSYYPTDEIYRLSSGSLSKRDGNFMTDAIGGARNPYPSGAPDFNSGFDRGATKRYSLSDLIAKLRAMVGSDEIHHSGRSSYLRFGAGGK